MEMALAPDLLAPAPVPAPAATATVSRRSLDFIAATAGTRRELYGIDLDKIPHLKRRRPSKPHTAEAFHAPDLLAPALVPAPAPAAAAPAPDPAGIVIEEAPGKSVHFIILRPAVMKAQICLVPQQISCQAVDFNSCYVNM
ncbi:hypothetical protein SKAU_G00094260 [Synaphobranchus kaupii]|uniref:Uncharacterized protein n=1 Tax=Synaphobranchus kaupii TaxID=118154 RepID=A0A9Q1FX50_SYNKA|nr:hypothetical protein SKAU_G00094260 [Synaphobranchus kaupii]